MFETKYSENGDIKRLDIRDNNGKLIHWEGYFYKKDGRVVYWQKMNYIILSKEEFEPIREKFERAKNRIKEPEISRFELMDI